MPFERNHLKGYVLSLEFSPAGCFLQTNIGWFSLQATPSGRSGGNDWVAQLQIQGSLWHGHKTLWTPPMHLLSRSAIAVRGQNVAVVRSSGGIYTVGDVAECGISEKENPMDPRAAHSTSNMCGKSACASYLHIRGEWIRRLDHNVIWLPPELHPYGERTIAVRVANMPFVHSSSIFSFWQISG